MFVILALIVAIVFQLPTFGNQPQLKLRPEIPISDKQSATKLLHGTVTEAQLESDLSDLGITLDKHLPGVFLPAKVSNVAPGSLALQSNIKDGDLVTKLERDKTATYVFIERSGKTYRAVISKSPPKLLEPKADNVAFNKTQTQAVRSGGSVSSNDSSGPEMTSGRVRLQIRGGAGGGNPRQLFMNGAKSIYIHTLQQTPINTSGPVSISEKAVAFFQGGFVPTGKIWVLHKIRYSGSAWGDYNGHGEFIVSAGGTEIVHKRNDQNPISGTWTGEITIQPGQEKTVYAEIANSSACDVILEGELIERSGQQQYHSAISKSLPQLLEPRSDQVVRSAIHARLQRQMFEYSDGSFGSVMSSGRVRLQIRGGAGGGNPRRLYMNGAKSIYVDTLQGTPINTFGSVASSERSAAFFQGGFVPTGKIWVLHKITYSGSAQGDYNGPGEFIVSAGGTEIVHRHNDQQNPIAGTWTGKLTIHPGQENTVYAQIRNSSACDVILEGELLSELSYTSGSINI